ncbi:MAG: hypothetical protein SGPRY_010316 [Prymnesium sp.]
MQDPVLFHASVRYNLDPFNQSSGEQLWAVLKKCEMHETVAALEGGLDHKVAENGSNFSVGQRQLLCLARATLRHSAVLVLDEATAAIDNDTDALIQAAIRSSFEQCTVMVFEKGELAEYDSPHALLAHEDSLFSSLVDKTGAAAAQLRAMAAEAARSRE